MKKRIKKQKLVQNYKSEEVLDSIDAEWLKEYENRLLTELYIAYLEARKGKRGTRDEQMVETNDFVKLKNLCRDLIDKVYKPSRGVAHVVSKPVIREIFAAPFIDRIMHHWIYNKIAGWWDRHFIYDSYSCREGKGTLMGIERLDLMIRRASKNYAKTTYVVKMDIQGYFMSINRKLLYERVMWGLDLQYKGRENMIEYNLLKYAIREIIFDDPVKGARLRGWPAKWRKLPLNKSLIYRKKGIGIVIGNLTSQLFSNILLDLLDRYIVFDLGYKYYGRYVDDFYIVVTEEQLKGLMADVVKIRAFLSRIGLKLHPKKFSVQKIERGTDFIGGVVYPGHIQPSERLKRNYRKALSRYADGDLTVASVVSYEGHMAHLSHRKLCQEFYQEIGW